MTLKSNKQYSIYIYFLDQFTCRIQHSLTVLNDIFIIFLLFIINRSRMEADLTEQTVL